MKHQLLIAESPAFRRGEFVKNKKIPPLTAEQLAELDYIHNMKDEEIDLSDISEITDEEFARIDFAEKI